ncbi:MAG: glycosyltransferase family 2 protein [Bacteroidota bacterium]|nr:glycosyltransferase family 2 protein [Bacteroidota bacterium]
MIDLVSVCIPVFNGAKFLSQAIRSVLDQTYTNLEILLIDDRSSDNSETIIKNFEEIDKRIRYIKNDINLGLVGNWQKCVKEAKGEWIKFLFQDDYMSANCVNIMYNEIKKNNTVMAMCSRNFCFEENCSINVVDFFSNKLKTLNAYFPKTRVVSSIEMVKICKHFLFFNIIGEPIVTLFNKKIFNTIGSYNPDLVQLVDYEFNLRVCFNFNTIFISEDLVTFRVHGEAASNVSDVSFKKQADRYLIEPSILYHEYLFNSKYSLLRSQISSFRLLFDAIKFYGSFSLIYPLEKSDRRELFRKYPRIYFFSLPSFIWKIKRYFKEY